MSRWRKLMFVLPNLFTVTSIFCGFYAMARSTSDATPSEFFQAALAIFFAMFFDGFDGRVARLTKTQSQFGVELDSLADVISFGAAPALLLYHWALKPLGFIGVFVCFAFAACGALRLARFNVLAQRHPEGGASKYFVGLPIPLAAGVVVAMVMAHHGVGRGEFSDNLRIPLAVVVLGLAALMVSTVRYRTFKDLKLTPKSLVVMMSFVAAGVIIASYKHPAVVLLAYFTAYLLFGLIDSAIGLRQEHHARKNKAASEDETVDEQDYL